MSAKPKTQSRKSAPVWGGRITRRQLFLAGGAALIGTQLRAADKDPTHITLLDFTLVDPYFVADLEIRRGVSEASMNADFQVRLSGMVDFGAGGTFAISPKSDPIASLLTKSLTDTPNGSTEVRQQFKQYKGPAGTGDVTLMVELLKPNGQLMGTSSLTINSMWLPDGTP